MLTQKSIKQNELVTKTRTSPPANKENITEKEVAKLISVHGRCLSILIRSNKSINPSNSNAIKAKVKPYNKRKQQTSNKNSINFFSFLSFSIFFLNFLN